MLQQQERHPSSVYQEGTLAKQLGQKGLPFFSAKEPPENADPHLAHAKCSGCQYELRATSDCPSIGLLHPLQ